MKQAGNLRELKSTTGCGPLAIVACRDSATQQLLISVLREFGVQPVVVEKLDEVQSLVTEKQTLMAFSQPRFSEGSFLDVLRSADSKASRTPVIVCSEFYNQELYIEAMALGAFDYLAFPISREEVVWVINKALYFGSPARGNSPPAFYPA